MTRGAGRTTEPRTGRAGTVAGLALGLVVLLGASACEATPSQTPIPTSTPEPTATVSLYQLDSTVWYAGLVMTFGTATATLDARGGIVSIPVQLQNPGTEDLTLDAPIHLTVAGASFEPTRETVLPSVFAGSGGYTTLTFNVVGQTTIAAATIAVGAPDNHQAIVPLGPAGPKLVALKPVELALHGTAVASDLRLALSGGELRWDLPDWGDELPSSSASLTLTYDVTYTGTFAGGTAFTGDNVSLLLPDGKSRGPRADGRSQSIAAIGPGKTLRHLSTRFEIPAGLPGTYTLVLSENGRQGRIRFTIPG
jgi:hypothetical protein